MMPISLPFFSTGRADTRFSRMILIASRVEVSGSTVTTSDAMMVRIGSDSEVPGAPDAATRRRMDRYETSPTRVWSSFSTRTWRMFCLSIRKAASSIGSSSCTVNRSVTMYCSTFRKL